jgi:phospholipid transport system substrate-binding protein
MIRLSPIRLVSRLVAVVFAAVLAAATVRAESGPVAVIDGLQATLLDVMKRSKELGIEGRYQVLEPRIEETFDLERMIRVAAGSQWTKASPEERIRLLDAFTRLTISTYASRFDGYSGESFENLGERPGPRDTVLVDTRIVRTDSPPVALNYVLEQKGDRWRVIDILLDGKASELAMRRSEYRSLGGGNAAGLAGKLSAKADELMAGQ